MNMDKSRVEKAVELFNRGYNCSQSLFVVYADLLGLKKEDALKLSVPFGGGIGGLGETCGATIGMFMVSGLVNGTTSPDDQEGKHRNYEKVQFLAGEFNKQHGSLLCSTLRNEAAATATNPNEKPCSKYIRTCAELIEQHLLK